MRRAIALCPAGHWSRDRITASITLAYADRHRRRIVLTDDGGADFLLDLPHAALLGDGDGLLLEDGGHIEVRAAEEDVAEVACPTPENLARIAWHVGNRHMPVQIVPGGRLRLPWDHVLVDMLTGLGASVERRLSPFHPEGGAYAQAHGHGHQDHDHPHGADHPPGAAGGHHHH